MPAERTDRETIERGEQARAIMEGPLFTEVIADAKKILFSRIENSQPDETDLRDACYFDLRAINSLAASLTDIKRHGEQKRKKVAN